MARLPLFCAVLDAAFGSPLVFIMLRQALYNVISSIACIYNEPWCHCYYIFSLLKLQQPNETIRGARVAWHRWGGDICPWTEGLLLPEVLSSGCSSSSTSSTSLMVITMRSLCCGLWSRGGHGDNYEVIVVGPVVMGRSWLSL